MRLTFRPSEKTNVVSVSVYERPSFSLVSDRRALLDSFREWILSGFEITPKRLNDSYVPHFMKCDMVRCALTIEGNSKFNQQKRQDRIIEFRLDEVISRKELKLSILNRITSYHHLLMSHKNLDTLRSSRFFCDCMGDELSLSIENSFNDEFWHLLEELISTRCERLDFKSIECLVEFEKGRLKRRSFKWVMLLDFDALVISKGAMRLPSSVAWLKSTFKGSTSVEHEHTVRISKNNKMSILLGLDRDYVVDIHDLLPDYFYGDLIGEVLKNERLRRRDDEEIQSLYKMWDHSGLVTQDEIMLHEKLIFDEMIQSVRM